MTEQEQWRPIPGFEGLYSVSDQGRVRRDGGGVRGATAGRILKPRWNTSKHIQVALCHDGERHYMLVHRLVMLAFVGPCPDGMECCHNNGNPADNRLFNLRYDTPRENSIDAHRYGGRTSCQKLSLDQVAEIRTRLAAGETQRSIARAYGVNQTTISDINTGRSWTHRLDQELASHPECPDGSPLSSLPL